jgi:hypothetical protein
VARQPPPAWPAVPVPATVQMLPGGHRLLVEAAGAAGCHPDPIGTGVGDQQVARAGHRHSASPWLEFHGDQCLLPPQATPLADTAAEEPAARDRACGRLVAAAPRLAAVG